MSAIREQTARLLLDRISQAEQLRVVRDVAKSLGESAGETDVGFAASLLKLVHDQEARSSLLDHLRSAVERGNPNLAAAVCMEHPELEHEMLARTIGTISECAGRPDCLVDDSPHGQRTLIDGTTGTPKQSVVEVVLHRLTFASQLVSSRVSEACIGTLFQACIDLLSGAHEQVSLKARDTIYVIFAHGIPLSTTQGQILWTCISRLLTAPETDRQTLGFLLWLKWSMSGHTFDQSILRQSGYWSSIVNGLRAGDTERRKLALQTLSASVDACTGAPSLLEVICAEQAAGSDSTTIRDQYSRYCTVFQTIILSRYLNQVQECEADLALLASEHSAVKPIWLFTLLGCALERKMQDSNRKFIGSWILQSDVRMDDPAAYLEFFRSAFLSWVTGGSLFTSSLRKKNGFMYCEHGETLAAHISQILQKNPNVGSGILDAILDSVLGRKGNNFAYAVMYLIEGIGRAVDSHAGVPISTTQLEDLTRVATWAGLPEVARDHILARSWKLCYDSLQESSPEVRSDTIASAAENWRRLQDKALRIETGDSAHTQGNIASIALEPSKRDRKEILAIEKCETLANALSSNNTEHDQVDHVLADIWNDLEYLEYPKSLLMILPSLMPHPSFVQYAGLQRSEGTLETMVAQRTQELLELAGSRASLLPPVARSIRRTALSGIAAASLIHADNLIIHMATHPPKPNIDERLEDAAVNLLQSLDPATRKLDHEYYFGPRESYGVAALLDLSSRVGAVDKALAERIFSRILERWVDQKTPPPSVSSWKTTLQLQVMLLCAEQWLPTAGASNALRTLKDLHYVLSIEPLPRLRYLMEWMIARLYIHHPHLRPRIIEELQTKDHHSNPKFLASLMKIGVTIARTDDADETYGVELATVFVPLAASSKVLIRHEAQWQVPILMDHATDKGWTAVSQNTAFRALDEFIRSLERFSEPPLERQIDKLDPIKDHTMTHLVEGPWWDLDHVESRQTSREDFVRIHNEDQANDTPLPPSCIPLGDPLPSRPVREEDAATSATHARKIHQNIDNISRALGAGPVPAPTALQTKGAAYLESASARTRYDDLLVISSLIDNPFNLGGLSRVSEIFGAGALYLDKPSVTSHKDFTGVSVSSHLHFPIRALPAAEIVEFVGRKKREEGFSVVGIEQTDRSVVLGEEGCVLPEKCILVLGSEREGIPALILAECDLLVEIAQVGVTRSLNVQTAAGIVLCEYARQRRKA